jgi:uncharacterized protein
MPRVLVVADSHGNTVKLSLIIRRESPFDFIIHCGDGAADLVHVDMPRGAAVVSVSGNVDLARCPGMERLVVRQIGPVTVMVAHGDEFRVNAGYEAIEREGRGRGADIVLFGHTHVAYRGGGRPVLFNPGPATNGRYGLLHIDGSIRAEHKSLED